MHQDQRKWAVRGHREMKVPLFARVRQNDDRCYTKSVSIFRVRSEGTAWNEQRRSTKEGWFLIRSNNALSYASMCRTWNNARRHRTKKRKAPSDRGLPCVRWNAAYFFFAAFLAAFLGAAFFAAFFGAAFLAAFFAAFFAMAKWVCLCQT